MKRGFSDAMACVGAVIGAGFASGREVAVFFTRYGGHSWWLILLSSAMMTFLCALCMQSAVRCGGAECWCAMFDKGNAGARICTVLLMVLIGAAMVSAAGQMVALLWASEWAYSLGAVGTLLLAWIAGFGDTRIFGWIGSGLAMLFLCIVIFVMLHVPAADGIVIDNVPTTAGVLPAAIRAVGYSAMNMTMAIGIVCRCAGKTLWDARRKAGLFGIMMLMLLCISNTLCMRHPSSLEAPFPIVPLLASFGRRGFVLSVFLLYLSIATTLIAVLYALRCAVEEWVVSLRMQIILTLGLPLGVSLVGFAGIIDHLYAPAGLMCLPVVFLPLVKKMRRNKEMLDNLQWIQ